MKLHIQSYARQVDQCFLLFLAETLAVSPVPRKSGLVLNAGRDMSGFPIVRPIEGYISRCLVELKDNGHVTKSMHKVCSPLYKPYIMYSLTSSTVVFSVISHDTYEAYVCVCDLCFLLRSVLPKRAPFRARCVFMFVSFLFLTDSCRFPK